VFSRQYWQLYFSGSLPVLPCPSCHSAGLAIVKDSLKEAETGASRAAHSEEYWTPEHEVSRFSALMRCRNCRECVAVGGTSGVEEDRYINQEGEEDGNYVSTYRPLYFHPAPPIFVVGRQCPAVVKHHLSRAFLLIWSDNQACANALRSGVEALLDTQKMPKFVINSRRKRVSISTHSRVEKLKTKNPEAAGYLMAIKWLGNAGSHETTKAPKRDELLDGFELFEEAIELLFMRKPERLLKLAKEITRRKGRMGSKRRATQILKAN
jgi:hypothetical protein